MKYASTFNALIIGHPQEKSLSQGAVSTSGKFATLRGLPSASPIAERIGLERDLALVEMTNARYHFDQITTISSIEVLKRAKKSGLDISAGTSIHHLMSLISPTTRLFLRLNLLYAQKTIDWRRSKQLEMVQST